MRKKILIVYLLLTSLLFSNTSDDTISWENSVNWESNYIELRIKKQLSKNSSTLASRRLKAENWIDENLTEIFFKNILYFKINSLYNISDIINQNPNIYYQLEELSERLTTTDNILSKNLEYLESVYKVPIYPDLLSIFYSQNEHLNLYKKLDHLNYGNFSGLIIYVPEELPLYQKNSLGNLSKVLFPRIFNEDMELIYDFTMIEPEMMEKWGMVIYGESFDESRYQERVGITPLRIIAKGLFGKNNSDIIISNEEANKLTGTINNLKIITQGRILILY